MFCGNICSEILVEILTLLHYFIIVQVNVAGDQRDLLQGVLNGIVKGTKDKGGEAKRSRRDDSSSVLGGEMQEEATIGGMLLRLVRQGNEFA